MAELDTSEANFGVVHQVAHLPTGTDVTRMAGGRYLALRYRAENIGPTTVGLFDSRSYSVVGALTFPGAATLTADDFHPRLFYRTPTEVGVIEPPSFLPRVLRASPDIALGDPIFCCRSVLYAAATNTLFISRAHSFNGVEFVAIDADTGAFRGVLPIDGGSVGLFVVNNEARKLYVPVTIGFYQTEIRTYDLDTFALVATTATYPVTVSSWSLDVTRQQILATRVSGGAGSGLWAVSLDLALTPKARVDFSYLQFNSPGSVSMNLAPSTVRDRVFAALGQHDFSGTYYTVPGKAFLVALDGGTLQPVATLDLLKSPVFKRGYVHAILLSPPPPPSPLEFTIAGRHAELTWRNPGDTTHFVMEIGTIPGRSNLGIVPVGNTTQFTADNVPPGTYYVRVRALNDVGMSLTSNEVTVVVPE